MTTSDDMTVDNNYGRLEAGANLRVVGTVASPGMDGRITLREGGEIFLAGRTFRITRGDISFTDLRRIHPEFNIAAEAPLGWRRHRHHDPDRHARAPGHRPGVGGWLDDAGRDRDHAGGRRTPPAPR